jgi:uncharacterized membrane protein
MYSMACGVYDCGFYIFLSVLSAISVFILFYIILYIYTAYITYRYHSRDLVRQREAELERVERYYKSLKI